MPAPARWDDGRGVKLLDQRRSRSKPDRGVVTTLNEVLNQDGAVVMTARGLGLFRARPEAWPVRE